MNRAALSHLEVRPGDHVLEIGFGGGDLLRMILDRGAAQVIGVDQSPAMADRARRRFAGPIAAGKVRILPGSADRMPLDDRSADKACSVNNLYFWENPHAVMAEFARVLRPGGRLLLGFQSAEQVRAWPGHRFGFKAHETEAVQAWYLQAGFADIRLTEATDARLGHFICLSGRLVDAKAGK